MRIARFGEKKSLTIARRNRLEIIQAGLSRREMIKLGLIGTTGYLVFKNGLSQWASGVAWASGGSTSTSPPTRAFIEPLPIMPIRRPIATLKGPAPTIAPNTSGGEGRTRPHQAFTKYPSKFPFPPSVRFETHQRPASMSMSPDLPQQPIWGHDGIWPAPT
jgi:hypothetical protein